MALKKRNVAKLNKIVLEYLEQLGMREEAKREFESKANAMIGVDSFKSVWFEKMTTQLYQVLHEMGERSLEIDLNIEPVIEDRKVVAAVEDEGRSDTDRKRKRKGESLHGSGTRLPRTALRIHESEAPASGPASGMPKPNNIRPVDHKHNNKVTLILVSDSDTDSD